jgi:NADH dehydrogenase
MSMRRVVIIGGGFGGAFTAKYLSKLAPAGTAIELINDTNYFVFQPLLPEVAAGTISAQDAVAPLRLMLPRVKVRMAEVRSIDFENRLISLVQGSKRVLLSLSYDELVIAAGQRTNQAILPGFAQHSLTMRDLGDAHALRNHVIQCLEHADVTENEALRQRLLTFVVAGGGFSGVETIGELAEMIRRTLRLYPTIRADDVRCILVQRGDRILPELPDALGDYALRKLRANGIDIRLETGILGASATSVRLDGGGSIDTMTLVTTIGNGPCALARQLPLELMRGRILTDRSLRVVGIPHAWAVGDVAAIPLEEPAEAPPEYAPPTAQFAIREARHLAGNLAAALSGATVEQFTYRPRGALASIGHYHGVGEVFGLRVTGVVAWLLWRAFYISILPTFSTRLRVALNWMYDYFLPRNIVQIKQKQQPACRFARFARGEVLFVPGQMVDGLYTVVSGALESSVPDRDSGESQVRVLGPGDHWGERTMVGELETSGTLRAIKDTQVLILGRDDFNNLRRTFKPLSAYLATILDPPSPLGGGESAAPRGEQAR